MAGASPSALEVEGWLDDAMVKDGEGGWACLVGG